MRVFGLEEETPGSTDEKVIELVNNHLALVPPLNPTEIEVSHRIGKSDNPKSHPRATLVKFVSRRSKRRVMKIRGRLKNLPLVGRDRKTEFGRWAKSTSQDILRG